MLLLKAEQIMGNIRKLKEKTIMKLHYANRYQVKYCEKRLRKPLKNKQQL